MPAIGRHKTATDDSAWNGPANVARLKSDGAASYYRRMFAWVDPDGDPATKGAYKFPNHFVSGGGDIGAASTRACSAGIAVLNGGRGGANIPSGDRRGVYNHLAGHMRDADLEPPELREDIMTHEQRVYTLADVEIREAEDGEPPVIQGYAAVYNAKSEDLGGFREIIRPGFFKPVLNDDVRALFNHDSNYVLGRNTAGTLGLTETERGLQVTVVPPDTVWANDLLVSMRRGDVNQMSFGFRVGQENWQRDDEDYPLRELITADRLFDVSVVTYPAYPQTSAEARAIALEMGSESQAAGLPDVDAETRRRRDFGNMRKELDLLKHRS